MLQLTRIVLFDAKPLSKQLSESCISVDACLWIPSLHKVQKRHFYFGATVFKMCVCVCVVCVRVRVCVFVLPITTMQQLAQAFVVVLCTWRLPRVRDCSSSATEYEESIPQTELVGDIRKYSDVLEAVRGVDCVIHCCGYVSIQTHPDSDGMEKVNVQGDIQLHEWQFGHVQFARLFFWSKHTRTRPGKIQCVVKKISLTAGTRNIINACIEERVAQLLYTSSDTSVVARRDYHHVDESLSYPREAELIMQPYAATKQRAEKLVLGAHRAPLADGKYWPLCMTYSLQEIHS